MRVPNVTAASNIHLKFKGTNSSVHGLVHTNNGANNTNIVANLLKLAKGDAAKKKNGSGIKQDNRNGSMKVALSAPRVGTKTMPSKALLLDSQNNNSSDSINTSKTATNSSSSTGGGRKRKAPSNSSSRGKKSVRGKSSSSKSSRSETSKSKKINEDNRSKRLEMNRIAAQLSRQRKKMKNEELEKQCAMLQRENAELRVVNNAQHCELMKMEIVKLRKQLELSPSISSLNMLTQHQVNAVRQQQVLHWRQLSKQKQRLPISGVNASIGAKQTPDFENASDKTK
eukprot:g1199.t1